MQKTASKSVHPVTEDRTIRRLEEKTIKFSILSHAILTKAWQTMVLFEIQFGCELFQEQEGNQQN